MHSAGWKFVFPCLTFVFLGLVLLPTAGAAPIMVIDDSEYFFGQVQNTETISHDFILTNEGDAPLHISAVRSDCGCVVATLARDTLIPGESVALGAKFNLKNRAGPQVRRIVVESNDRDQPRLVLLIMGEAVAPVVVEPERIYWGNIYFSGQTEKSVEIKFSEGDESYINSVVSTNPAFLAECVILKPRRHYKIVIRARPPLPIGGFESTLRVLTDHPRYATIEIPMQGRVIRDLYSIPDEIALEFSGKESASRPLLVCSGLKKKFKIIRIELPAPGIEAKTRPLAVGNGYRINLLNLKPSMELNGKNIVIVTDCEAMPNLIVPIKVTGVDGK